MHFRQKYRNNKFKNGHKHHQLGWQYKNCFNFKKKELQGCFGLVDSTIYTHISSFK